MYRVDILNHQLKGKAGQLQRLQKNNIPTGKFAVFAFNFFDSPVFQQNFVFIFKDKIHPKETSRQLQNLLVSFYHKESLDELRHWLENFAENQLFSVRSSASLEDQGKDSFAGQFESKLMVDKTQVVDEIEKVLVSLYSERVLEYCQEKTLDIRLLTMEIIVQEMIVGDISGIYFTANPHGLINQEVAVLGYGSGDLIVSDQVPTSTYYFHPDDQLMFLKQEDNTPKLTNQQLTQLQKLVEKVKAELGPYLDIEFTIQDTQVFILQSRPITSLHIPPKIILDNSNIVESYPGITLPLTYRFTQDAYSGMFTSLAKRIVGPNSSALCQYQERFDNMIYAYQGRIYYQLQNWLAVLKLLPFSKHIIPIWKDMLGVRKLEIEVEGKSVSFLDKAKIIVNIIKELILIQSKMGDLNNEFYQVESFFDHEFPRRNTINELFDLYYYIKDKILLKWDLTFINDLYAFIFTGLLKKFSQAEEVNRQIAGIENISSMEPVMALNQLIYEIKFMNIEGFDGVTREEAEELLTEHPRSGMLIDQFIDQFGDRAPEELKLETKTFRTHPEALLQIIHEGLLEEENNSHIDNHKSRKPLKHKNPFLRFLAKKSSQGIAHRESSRLNRTRLYGMTRAIFRKMGQILVSQGKLDNLEEIFYLNFAEIELLNQGKADGTGQKIVRQRKSTTENYYQLPSYSRLIFDRTIFEINHLHTQINQDLNIDQSIIQGIGCSQGQVKGPVIIINDVSQVKPSQVKGKIIVTKMTDPGWVYLLTQAKGIIAEKGSLLSHTAIISRELGIPSVVNVKRATQIFENQQIIMMDGTDGRIKIEKGD